MSQKNSLITAIVVVALLVLLTSCCKHEWTDATCTAPQTCTKCGVAQGEALGHKYGEDITLKEATCTENGVKEVVCPVCGDRKTSEIPAEHRWEFVGTERVATCSEEGQEKYKCSICGETKFEPVAKLKHQYKDGYCINCFTEDLWGVDFNPSKEEKEQIAKVKAIGDRAVRKENDFYYLLFSFSDKDSNSVIAPCLLEIRIVNDREETVYKAKRVIDTNDYGTWSNAYRKWILASPKIMRSDIREGSSSLGTLYFTVKFEDTYFKEYGLEISDLPVHSFGKEETIAEATCGTEGLVRKACSSCGNIVEEKIPATGRHTYRKGTVLKQPTCHSKGVMEYACTVCKAVGKTEEIDRLEHSFVNDKCGLCGTLRIGSEGPAGGWIFYDCDLDNEDGNADGLISSECGWRFLEAAPADVGKAEFGYYRHNANGDNLCVNGNVEYYEENCTRKEVGYGKSNTKMLVDAMENGAYVSYYGSKQTSQYAAKMCADYSVNGYNDWFLPSDDELTLMYVNLLAKNNLGNFRRDVSSYYWSSSESGSYHAQALYFYTWSSSRYANRSNENNVRPIRSFL